MGKIYQAVRKIDSRTETLTAHDLTEDSGELLEN